MDVDTGAISQEHVQGVLGEQVLFGIEDIDTDLCKVSHLLTLVRAQFSTITVRKYILRKDQSACTRGFTIKF